jgi:polyvinyl alcohol dehydrogenase (cytochrome)
LRLKGIARSPEQGDDAAKLRGRLMRFSPVLLGVLCAGAIFAIFFGSHRNSSGVIAAPGTGEAVYLEYCAACHDHPGPRVPPRSALQELSAARILHTLDFGVMMSIAYPLQRTEREAVAKFLGKPGNETGPPPSAFCSNRSFSWVGDSAAGWPGWSTTSSNDRFQSAERAGLSVPQVRNLKLKWAFGFAGDITAFAAPTIQNGVLFTGSAAGVVHAMNARSGCLYWTFQADGPVRAATLIAKNGVGYSILFGDLTGWFYSLDAFTGRLLWKHRIDAHEATRLTASAVAQDGIVYVPAASWEETRSANPKYSCCTFRGSVTALRIRDGSEVWKAYTIEPPKQTGVNRDGVPQFGPSGAGSWSAPTSDAKRGVLYLTTTDNYSNPATKTSDAVLALSLKTGEILWSQQMTSEDVYSWGACPDDKSSCGPDFDFGSSAILVHPRGRDLLIAGQKSGIVYALDPDEKGKILWQVRVGTGGTTGGVQWGMASDENNVYAAVSDIVHLPDSLARDHASLGGANFDPVRGGGLTALRLTDGSKAWFAPSYPCVPPRPGCSPAQSAAVTGIPGAIFSGAMDGHLRAFSTGDGQLLWDFDTVREYPAVNGIKAKGGSLDGAGPIVVDGMVYVNSGYPRFGGNAGNVLLAFGVDDARKD